MTEEVKCIVCSYQVNLQETFYKKVRSNVRKFHYQTFTVWRCPNCQCLHSQEPVDLDKYYAHYPLEKQTLDYFRKRICQNRLNLLIQHGVQKEDKILDYGCNQGLFVEFLHKKGYVNAVGYDPYISKYSNRNLLEYKYDYITCQDVIEHVENPHQCFSQLVNCLKKDGTLILGTPNAEEINLDQTNDFLLHLHQPYHRHILSEKALLDLGKAWKLKPIAKIRRWVNDSLYPFVNTRLSWAYARSRGNDIDVLFEPIQMQVLFRSPQLLFYGFFGYFFPLRGNLIIVFQKSI